MKQNLSASRFWRPLCERYVAAPSIYLCRVPELEYAATLDVSGKVLDHCCGDGQFAALAWPGKKLTAGCDFNEVVTEVAAKQGIYTRVDTCNACQRLPYETGTFDLVFDNSALEHLPDLPAALAEVSRVLAPQGVFAFNVLNHRYFEWWPLDEAAKNAYREWQPFFHALSLEEWKRMLAKAGMRVKSVEGYFDRRASRELALLDYAFSSVYLGQRRSAIVWSYWRAPALFRKYWRQRVSSLTWKTAPDEGAGYFIQAVRADS